MTAALRPLPVTYRPMVPPDPVGHSFAPGAGSLPSGPVLMPGGPLIDVVSTLPATNGAGVHVVSDLHDVTPSPSIPWWLLAAGAVAVYFAFFHSTRNAPDDEE